MSKDCISYASFVACRVNGKRFYHYYFWIIISFVIKLQNAECTNAVHIPASHYGKGIPHKAKDGNQAKKTMAKKYIRFIFAWKINNMRTLKNNNDSRIRISSFALFILIDVTFFWRMKKQTIELIIIMQANAKRCSSLWIIYICRW